MNFRIGRLWLPWGNSLKRQNVISARRVLNFKSYWYVSFANSKLYNSLKENIQIKGEMDTLERTKDEESKNFQSHNIHFNFHILVQIKESLVDVSSNCMELALKVVALTFVIRQMPWSFAKWVDLEIFLSIHFSFFLFGCIQEKREARTANRNKTNGKMLWRAFQFAFRVYSFAGGHDDRADKLTRELAHEIETDPHHK